MIIDGKLVVSKKKKLVLVQELKEKGFKAMPKRADAIKEGELAPIADNDEEEEEDSQTGAAVYDYLLGVSLQLSLEITASNSNLYQMPIWSLTKERVEKLLNQVGDKEIEIDTLIKLTKEDLWTRDLDDFLAEWRFQLDDEAKRQKKVANMGRRASKKLKIAGGVAGRKRKNDSDDDDFNVAPVKVKKAAMPKKEVGGLLSYMMPETKTKTKASPKSKPKAPTATQKAAKRALDLISTSAKGEDNDDAWMNVDGSGSDVPKVTKPKAAPVKATLPKKKAEPVPKKTYSDEDEEDADEEIVRPTASRRPRGAAAKQISYNVDDSDSDGDDMLFDVGKMVKGINTASVPAEKTRPLFSASTSRPGSSAGLPKKSASSKPAVDIDSDDANYSKLAPPVTTKGPAVTAKKTILSDDDDDDDDSLGDIVVAPPKASKPASKASTKPAPKAKAPAPAKKVTKAAPPPEPKQMPLSPAAKAYAAKKAKAEKAALKAKSPSDDDLEGLVDEILDDDDEEEDVGARRRARRAASAAPKKWVISDDEDEPEESTMQLDDGDSDD